MKHFKWVPLLIIAFAISLFVYDRLFDEVQHLTSSKKVVPSKVSSLAMTAGGINYDLVDQFPTPGLRIEGKIQHYDQRLVPDDFLGLIDIDGHRLFYFKDAFKQSLDEEQIYNIVIGQLHIPGYFEKVNIEMATNGEPVITGTSSMNAPKGYNGLFALAVNQFPTEDFKVLSWGKFNCAYPGTYILPNGNNAHQFFFKFRHHYFTPILLSTGATVYYSFENEGIMKDWIRKLNSDKKYAVAGDAPVYYENILGIFIIKDAKLIEM